MEGFKTAISHLADGGSIIWAGFHDRAMSIVDEYEATKRDGKTFNRPSTVWSMTQTAQRKFSDENERASARASPVPSQRSTGGFQQRPSVLRPSDRIYFSIPHRNKETPYFKATRKKFLCEDLKTEDFDASLYKRRPQSMVSLQTSATMAEFPYLHFGIKYDPRQKVLYVRIVCAKNLPAMDMNGLSDPYIKAYLVGTNKQNGKESAICGIFQTRVHYRTLDPVFNEAFQIPIRCTNFENIHLKLWIYDYDFMTRDDLIGAIVIKNVIQRLNESQKPFLFFKEIIDRQAKVSPTNDLKEKGEKKLDRKLMCLPKGSAPLISLVRLG